MRSLGKNLIVLTLIILGIFAAVYLVTNPAFKISQASTPVPPKHAGTIVGTAAEGTKVTSGSVTPDSSALYVATITTKPQRQVNTVVGLNLNWEKVKVQCGARAQTSTEVWIAKGSASSGTVTASLEKEAKNSIITVSKFANVDLSNPVSNVYGVNTLGINGACEGGKDTEKYAFDVVGSNNSLIFGSVATRLRTHQPSAGFTEIKELQYGKSNGDKAGVALISKQNLTAGNVRVEGKLSSDTDWAVVVMSINGMASVEPVPTATPAPTPTAQVTAQPTTVPTTTPSTPPGTNPDPTLPPPPPVSTNPVKGIWTSPAELSNLPMSGDAWNQLKSAADSLSNPNPNLDNQDDDTNVKVLAAAIVFARTKDVTYQNKVIDALQKVEKFQPTGRTLAWGRETGAYAMAADLIGYRTPAFEKKMRDMAETYKGSQLNVTLLDMYKRRPNNWGSQAFSSLAAIYSYLGDTARLQEIRDYYVASVTGQKTQAVYGELSWQCDSSRPNWINPKDCVITCGGSLVNVDGIIPDDMRRGGSCRPNPISTGYPWEGLQGFTVAGRVLERSGMPIWQAGDRAICRAASALQDGRFGSSWRATGDDVWQLPFLDEACGTNWSAAYTDSSKWASGKNAGWGYVTLN